MVEQLKKNVIVICIDGTRIDRAQKSNVILNNLPGRVFFSNTITYAPYTNSSIYAMFSGSYGNRNGCFSYWHSFKFHSDRFKTLTEYLHDDNFFTYADIHSKISIPKQGFDEYVVYDELENHHATRHKNILNKMKKIYDNGTNFFLYLHYDGIHKGIMNSVLKVYNNFSTEFFDNRSKNESRYDDFFHDAENYLQELIDTITLHDLWKDSIVLIFSDHGCSVGEKIGERAYGAYCYDYTLRTFSSFITPDFKQQEFSNQIRHIDLMPTILDFLKIPLDPRYESLDGHSLLPLIKNQHFEESIAYSETANPLQETSPPKKPNTKSVRTSKWKLIFNEYNNTKELYNLESDPNEKNNLSGTDLEIEKFLFDELLKLQHN
jgi:arylsulfatase A-like enzyme